MVNQIYIPIVTNRFRVIILCAYRLVDIMAMVVDCDKRFRICCNHNSLVVLFLAARRSRDINIVGLLSPVFVKLLTITAKLTRVERNRQSQSTQFAGISSLDADLPSGIVHIKLVSWR